MKTDYLLSCLGLLLIVSVTIVVGSIVGGWVLSILWYWFISRPFGLIPLSIPHAIGISMVVGMMTAKINQSSATQNKNTSDVIALLLSTVTTPLLYLFIGWIVHLFL